MVDRCLQSPSAICLTLYADWKRTNEHSSRAGGDGEGLRGYAAAEEKDEEKRKEELSHDILFGLRECRLAVNIAPFLGGTLMWSRKCNERVQFRPLGGGETIPLLWNTG